MSVLIIRHDKANHVIEFSTEPDTGQRDIAYIGHRPRNHL